MNNQHFNELNQEEIICNLKKVIYNKFMVLYLGKYFLKNFGDSFANVSLVSMNHDHHLIKLYRQHKIADDGCC